MRLRLTVAIFATVLLCSCGGETRINTINSDAVNATLVNKPSQALTNEINGIWKLNKPVTIHFMDSKLDQPDLPLLSHMYSQSATSKEAFFEVDNGQVNIITIIERESEHESGNPTQEICVHKQLFVESWLYQQESNYYIRNIAQSFEAKIQANSTALFIEHNKGNTKHDRVDPAIFNSFPNCTESTRRFLPLRLMYENLVSQPSEFEGSWRIVQSTDQVVIGLTGVDTPETKQQFLQIDNSGKGKVWLLDEKNACFIHANQSIHFSKDGSILNKSTSFNNQQKGSDILAFYLPAEITKGFNGSASKEKILYFINLYEPDTNPPYIYTRTPKPIDFEARRCDLPKSEIKLLPLAQTIEDVKGIWDLTRSNSQDKKILAISDNLEITQYDYRGDSANNGASCYQKSSDSYLIYLGNDLFEEVTGRTLNMLVSLHITEDKGLVILSENKHGDKYNRNLQRDAALEQTGISPLCPSVRN